MSLKQKIIDDLKTAMKEGDIAKRDVLRMLDSMVKNAEIEKKKKEEGLSDEEVREVVARAVKQRRDAASQFEAGARKDLAEKERKEMEILSGYLPEQMSEEKIRDEIKNIITQTGAGGKSDTGRVMGTVMKHLKGKADGQTVKRIVEEELG